MPPGRVCITPDEVENCRISSSIEALGVIGLSTGGGSGASARVGMGEEVGDIGEGEGGYDGDDKRGNIACDEERLPGLDVHLIALRSKRTPQLEVDVTRETGIGRTGGEGGEIRPGEVASAYRSWSRSHSSAERACDQPSFLVLIRLAPSGRACWVDWRRKRARSRVVNGLRLETMPREEGGARDVVL